MTHDQDAVLTEVLVMLVRALTKKAPQYGWRMRGTKPVFVLEQR